MKRNFQGLLIILALLVLCALPKTLGDGDGEAKGTGKSPAFGSLKKDSSKEVYTNETNNDAGEGEDGGKPKETIAHVRPYTPISYLFQTIFKSCLHTNVFFILLN